MASAGSSLSAAMGVPAVASAPVVWVAVAVVSTAANIVVPIASPPQQQLLPILLHQRQQQGCVTARYGWVGCQGASRFLSIPLTPVICSTTNCRVAEQFLFERGTFFPFRESATFVAPQIA